MRFSTLAVLALSLAFSPLALAENEEPKGEAQKLEPATRYSGSSPIDLKHGLPGGNGTYGLRDTNYEEWAKQNKIVPGVNDSPYAYTQKESLLQNLAEQVMWGETAIANWKNSSSNKPEVSAYAKQAAETMSPLLEKLKDATKTASGAGAKDWSSAEQGARKALSDFRSGYRGLHHNITTH